MADVKQTLNGFIDYSSPKLATVLNRTWKNQQQAITYKEIREAIYNGQLDMSYLQQWQQDYSKFIINGYAPLAQQAIDNAAKGLVTRYGVNLRDTTPGYIDSFISQHGGQLIREVSEEQYKAINVLVRQATMAEDMTVDQLARAIRPTVGLTTRQSQAAMNVYNQAIADGYTPQQARNIQAKYAERVHRIRANTIAQTEMAYAFNYGEQMAVEQAIKDGLIGSADKEWSTAEDERVCKHCGPLDGETVPLDGVFSIGKKLPPAHPNCRCAIKYVNILPPTSFSQTSPGQPQVLQDVPEIPDDLNLKFLECDGQINLGGTGEMYAAHDNANMEYDYIFKPAQTKSGKPEEFRAYVQEAGYKVQGIIDPDSAVECGATSLDIPGKGKVFGAAQRHLDDLDKSFNLRDWQDNGGPLDSNIVSQLQRENVTDWLLCNYDSHGGNFVLGTDGKLYGIDKEQAFRYIGQSGAQSMSLTFHPNAAYGEHEPIYNTLYRRFANGEIDIRLNDTLSYIKRIEAIPDNEYREIFRQYAEALHGKGAKAEQLLDQIVSRKQNLRSTFESFYSDLLTQRKGTKTVFAFADNAAAQMLTSPATAVSTFNPATLKTMKIADLQALAKSKGIKHFGIMHKDELIDVISDPSKIKQTQATAVNRWKQQQAVRNQKKTQTVQGTKINGVTKLSDALKDIDGTLQGSTPRGVPVISDSTALEGLQATIRKVEIDGKTYYELTGKMTERRWEQAAKDLQGQKTGSNWHYNYASGAIDYKQPTLQLTGTTETFSIGTQYIRNGDDVLIIAGSDASSRGRALMGQFNIRVQAGDGADAARKIQSLMQQARMTDIADDVTTEAIDRYKKMRVIWQTDPKLSSTLDPVTSTDAQIDAALKKLGITQARLDKIEIRKVTDGYFTFFDPENLKIAKKLDAAYLYHQVNGADSVAAVMESGELLATTNRWGRGIISSGMSSSEDVRTGGADSVFTRLVFNNQVGKEEPYSTWSFSLIFDTSPLERTDWYAYTGDTYGKTAESYMQRRLGTEEHFTELKRRYHDSNEVMFRKTLPLNTLKEIRTPTDSDRQQLITLLHNKGITRYNGILLEDFIKVGVKLL